MRVSSAFFPTALAVLSLAASAVYLLRHSFRLGAYYFLAGAIYLALTYLKD